MARTAPPLVSATVCCLNCHARHDVPIRLRRGPDEPDTVVYQLHVDRDAQAILTVWAEAHLGPFDVERR